MIRLSLLCVLTLLGCGEAQRDRSYLGNARYTYQLGMEALNDSNYLDAVQHFSDVRTKYPYSKYAALADVRTADTYFAQEKFVDAISQYRTFIQRRPNHREVAHAMRRIGDSYFSQRPSSFFLLPPPHEMDRGTVQDAVRSYRAFLKRFQKDPGREDVVKNLGICRKIMADHEMYVADFYLNSSRPLSARARLERIYETFDDVPETWRVASVRLVEVYLALTRPNRLGKVPLPDGRKRAQLVVAELSKRFPKSSETRDARNVLRTGG